MIRNFPLFQMFLLINSHINGNLIKNWFSFIYFFNENSISFCNYLRTSKIEVTLRNGKTQSHVDCKNVKMIYNIYIDRVVAIHHVECLIFLTFYSF